MERMNREDDEVATRPHQRSALPGLEAFNPRIRIIGVPTATLPAPLRQHVPDHQNWEDAAEPPAAISAGPELSPEVPEAPASPVSVRAIMDVGAALPVPSPWDVEEPAPPTQPPLSSDPPTTRKPTALAPPADPGSDSGIRRARPSSEGSVVTSAPELPLSCLSWDERDNTDVLARPEESRPGLSPLAWEDDEVTMPRKDGALRAQARALATVNAAREAALERAGVSRRLLEGLMASGPHGTLVDEGERASEAKTLVGRGDTLVDAEPPSEIVRESERREREDEDEEHTPDTQPSIPPPARSIEIDLADLDSRLFADSELTRDDLSSLAADEHTPVPAALRTPSTPPLDAAPAGSSLSPVAIPESVPRTRVSATPRGRGGAVVAIGAILTLCLGVIAFVLYPTSGSLSVRLSTPDADGVAKAEIFVDGQKRCDTDPCILRDLAPGEHVIKVVAPGRTSEVTTVVVEPNEAAQVTVRLSALATEAPETKDAPPQAPETPGLTIELATEGARVLVVRGSATRVLSGPFPQAVDLAPGRYKVVASRFGFAPFVRWVTVEGGKEKVVVELEAGASAPASRAPEGAEDAASREPAAETPPPAADTDGDIYE